MKLKKGELTYKIIGVAMEVHNELGSGFLESVYQEAVEIEFNIQKIPYVSQPKIELFYKGKKLKKYYIPDFIAFTEIIVEIKAEKCLTNNDEAQLINSLKCTNKKVGLLINFGEEKLKFKRFVN